MVFVRFFPKNYKHFGLSEGLLRYEGQNHEGPYMSHIGAWLLYVMQDHWRVLRGEVTGLPSQRDEKTHRS